jgi:hypothetical protein
MNHSYINKRKTIINTNEYPLQMWWNQYMKALFIMTLFWEPSKETTDAMNCFLTSLMKMFPKEEIRKFASDFLSMKQYVIDLLKEYCESFFRVYPSYLEVMNLSKNTSNYFLEACLQSSESLFIFLFLFQSFILIMHNKQGHNVHIPHFMDIKYMFDINKINKYDWGRPLWFIIHTVALYAPDPLTESYNNYKQILTCLQYLLPCPKCRTHLSDNLQQISLDKCGKTREDMFKCSWELHNIVNKDTNKPTMALYEALSIYK